MMLLRVQ